LEISQQLEKKGAFSNHVILFDTIPPPEKPKKDLFHSIEYYLVKLINYIKKGTILYRIKDFINRKYRRFIHKREARKNTQLRIKLHISDIASKYHPSIYSRDVLLFISENRPRYPYEPEYRINLWDKILIGDVESHVVSGEHINILKEPHVKKLTPILNKYLFKID
jgi:thioesterase domain-containing protein